MSPGLNAAHFSFFSRSTDVDNSFKFFSLYYAIVVIAKLRTDISFNEPSLYRHLLNTDTSK